MKIGFIGLGIMGESMCENIVKKHDDTVYCFDFIPAKVELLASKGAVPCKDSVELAEKSDVIISMVPKSEHSMSVYKTILPVLGAGKTCIDMSTIDPSVSVEISKMVKATGAAFMDAPVVKSKPAAIAVKLGICMNLAKECGLDMPGEANVKKVYDKGMEAGMGGDDWRSTFKLVRGH